MSGLRDDSVVRDYNLTLECTAQGSPTPTVYWYKDDVLLTPSRNIKIRTRKLRRKMILRSRGTRTPRQSPNPFLNEGIGRRRRIIRQRRGGGGGGVGRDGGGGGGGSGGVFGEMQRDEGVRGAAATEKKRRTRGEGGRRREGGERKRLTGRRRVAGDEEDEEEEEEGRGAGGSEGPRKVVEGRRRRLRGRKSGNADSTHHRSAGAGSTSSTSSGSSISRETSGGPSSSGRRHPSSGSSSGSGGSSSRRTGKMITSTLVVREVSEEDAGVYKCVAKSVAGEATSQARIRVVPPIDPHPFVDKCPIAGYCLNGGTCMMFKIVGELVCQCAEGFKGQRCQEKEVYPTFLNYRHPLGRHQARLGLLLAR